MRRLLKIGNIVLSGLFIIALSGCNGDKGKHVNKTYTVVIQQMKFTPADLTINNGDTVIWINKDMVEHNVTAETKDWSSPNLSPGMSWNRVMEKSAAYMCTLHPVMKGSLNVK